MAHVVGLDQENILYRNRISIYLLLWKISTSYSFQYGTYCRKVLTNLFKLE